MKTWGAALFALSVLVETTAANAFVRSRTTHGKVVFWPETYVFIQPDLTGTVDMPADLVFQTIQKSMQNWAPLTQACSYLQLKYDMPAVLEAHYDGVNVVKFRADKWCHPEDPQSHNQCYDASAAAITTVFYADRPGESADGNILDADIELNNVNFSFGVVDAIPPPSSRPGTMLADLENTLTHEIGHLQGLDHTCADNATPANEVDDTGQPPPPCNGPLTAKITNATMFNDARPGETKKRSVEADDAAGICDAYPLAKDPHIFSHSSLTHSGCTVVPGAAESAPLSAILVLGLFGLAKLLSRSRRRIA